MKNTFLFLSFCFFIFSSCTPHYYTQSAVGGKQIKLSKEQTIDAEGVCWQECIMPTIYKDEVTTYHVYTGDASLEEVELEEVVVETKPAVAEWEKRKKPGNCKSKKDDCYMWCFVKKPAETKTWTILKNPSQSENFEIKEISKKVLVKKGGYIEKQRVVCDEKMTESLVMELQQELENQKFNTGAPAKKLNAFVREGLHKYQRANNLPVGMLNFQTMDKLGVTYAK